MPKAKVDLPSTIAAMLAVTQAAAATMGVLAIWTTAEGVLDIPQVEQVAVGLATLLVALALGLGCAQTVAGYSLRLLVPAFVGSLLLSAYWGLLRPPADGLPIIPVIYAVPPLLGLSLLVLSAANARNRRQADQVPGDPAPAASSTGARRC